MEERLEGGEENSVIVFDSLPFCGFSDKPVRTRVSQALRGRVSVVRDSAAKAQGFTQLHKDKIKRPR
jgi:hypothetical protein